jgi:hypothetical protein
MRTLCLFLIAGLSVGCGPSSNRSPTTSSPDDLGSLSQYDTFRDVDLLAEPLILAGDVGLDDGNYEDVAAFHPTRAEINFSIDDPLTVLAELESEKQREDALQERLLNESRSRIRSFPPRIIDTSREAPVPTDIPYTDPHDFAAYTQHYKDAYARALKYDGHIMMTCCLRGDVPNREARIAGHYAGVRDANQAKVTAGLAKLELKHRSRPTPHAR